jgi:hypothetical protein
VPIILRLLTSPKAESNSRIWEEWMPPTLVMWRRETTLGGEHRRWASAMPLWQIELERAWSPVITVTTLPRLAKNKSFGSVAREERRAAATYAATSRMEGEEACTGEKIARKCPSIGLITNTSLMVPLEAGNRHFFFLPQRV